VRAEPPIELNLVVPVSAAAVSGKLFCAFFFLRIAGIAVPAPAWVADTRLARASVSSTGVSDGSGDYTASPDPSGGPDLDRDSAFDPDPNPDPDCGSGSAGTRSV